MENATHSTEMQAKLVLQISCGDLANTAEQSSGMGLSRKHIILNFILPHL